MYGIQNMYLLRIIYVYVSTRHMYVLKFFSYQRSCQEFLSRVDSCLTTFKISNNKIGDYLGIKHPAKKC